MRALSFILFTTAFVSIVNAQESLQEDTSDFRDDSQWERILETAAEADENSTAVEEAAQLEDNPVNINAASVEELHRIPALSNLIASRIIERRKRERFTSIDELLQIEGITPDILSFVRRFVRIGSIKEGSDIGGSFLSRVSTETEERHGYINGSYPGSSLKVLNRLHLSLGKNSFSSSSVISDLEVGVLTKKDPGERGIANFSAYFAGFNVPFLETHFILGDYQIESAEGLIFWRASAFGKGSDVISPARKNGGGNRPYLSSDENSFFRGISASVNLNKVQIQILYSNKAINATIDSLDNISSIYKSGLFRTESEIRKQNSSRETLVGCRAVTYPFNGLKVGGSYYRTRFTNPLVLSNVNSESVYELWMKGIDISFTSENIDLFSECAFDRANELAVIAGLTYEPGAELALIITARNYPAGFQSIHGNAFGESGGQVQNENGVYAGIRSRPISWLSISTYYDQFSHPQPTYLLPAPSHGNDFLVLTEFQLTKQFEIAFRYKRKDLPSVIYENDIYGRTLQKINPRVQKNYRLTGEFNSPSSLRLTSRVEWVTVNYGGIQNAEVQNAVQGVLISQAIKWKIFNQFTVQTRLAVFGTDSYDSAIYEYEEDVPGAYSNPPLFGRGMRWYLILRYQLLSKMNIAAKYAHTVKEGVKSIGTGLDEVSGDSQGILSMQVEVRL